MAKDPNRVKAGKRAWAKKSPAQKASIIARLKHGKKKSRHSGSSTRGSAGMANKSRQGQGLGSWASSVLAWIVALSNPIVRIGQSMKENPNNPLGTFAFYMVKDYTGAEVPALYGGASTVAWKWENLIRGYAPIAGAVGIKKGYSYMQKIAPIKSLIPNLRM